MDALKKWMIIWFTPNQTNSPTPYRNGYSPKSFVQIILAAKWLARHSRESPKQQRRPLHSLLHLSFFYASEVQ